LVPFRDRSWRFFYEHAYEWDLGRVGQGEEALGLLVGHDSYQFASPTPSGPVGSPDAISGSPRHGPYNLDCISKDSYLSVDRASAMSSVLSWLDKWNRSFVDRPTPAPTPETAREELDRLNQLLSESGHIYLLRDFPEDCYAKRRYVGPWCELVTVNLDRRLLTMFMASGD
jgi:hypothetical protein